MNFASPDTGDVIDLHHIFGNKESVLFRDIAALTHTSHRTLTGTTRGMSRQQQVELANTIYKRKALLFELSQLEVNVENEIRIRAEFNDILWAGMTDANKQEWIHRWQDKDRLSTNMWFDLYEMNQVLYDFYDAIFILNRDQSSNIRRNYQFAQWFFNVYVPFMSSQSDNK